MKPFEYATPGTLKEATALLADTWGKAEVLAGGTDLVTSLKQGITTPQRLVSLKHIKELRGIAVRRKTLQIGAMTTLAELAEHRTVQKEFPALVTAIHGIGSPQMVNAGTIGGDLCQRPRCWYFRNGFGLFGHEGATPLAPEGDNRYHAIFGNNGPAKFVSVSSLGPALIALNATMTATGPDGRQREIAATEFFVTPTVETERETVLRPNEILTAVDLPIQNLKNATYEVRHRHGLDWPYVTASVAFALNGGVASETRIVLGHVAPVPWPVAKAAGLLNGARPSENIAARCGEAAILGATPLSGNTYKVQMVKTAVKRALLAATGA